ncbi:delta-class carbonic anhydrase, partial [Vibrio sp. F13]
MNKVLLLSSVLVITPQAVQASSNHDVADSVIAQQRTALAENTQGKGFGPQSPRDIDNLAGNNTRYFGKAPEYSQMNLCNVHFHRNAEHKGGEFNVYAGNGDGKGNNTG